MPKDKLPHSLREFLAPIWRYYLKDKYNNNPNVHDNQVIIHSFDRELSKVEARTMASKGELYLSTATGEYLDYFGSWIGLERLGPNESDDHYRARLKNHILHPRATIPALRTAISKYLSTHVSNVHIYEPWQDEMYSNDFGSLTNSRAHFNGDYYRVAIINIVIYKPFDKGLVDIINWFRPAGVVFLFTYDNGESSSVWNLSGSIHPIWSAITADVYTGFNREERYDLNFLDKIGYYGANPFYVSGDGLKLSNLNGEDVLVDPTYLGKQYYSYMGTLHGLLNTSNNDNIDSLTTHTVPVNPDLYPNLNKPKGLIINITHNISTSNILDNSEDLTGTWKRYHHTYLSGSSDNGNASIRLTDKKSILSDIQLAHGKPLRNGFIYYIGFDLKASNAESNVNIQVTLNNGQILHFSGLISAKHWTHFAKQIVYHGKPFIHIHAMSSNNGNLLYNAKPIIKVTYQVINKDYHTGDIDFSSPYIERIKDSGWTPNNYDLGNPTLGENSEFAYCFLNVWAFYFKYVESREDVYNKISSDSQTVPTPQQINQYISNHFNKKLFSLVYDPLIKDSINTRLWIMNYEHNSWINYDTHLNVAGNQDDYYNLRFGNLASLINNQGFMVIGLQVPAFKNDYKIAFHYLGMSFDNEETNQAGIQIFKPSNHNVEAWVDYDVLDYMNWDSTNKYPMCSKEQRHYPIRYIRNWIKNVTYNHNDNRDFIVNKSIINGPELMQAYSNTQMNNKDGSVHYIKPFWNYDIIPSLTKHGNPVKSVSILGTDCGDKYPTNRLNNLLKNSVFGYFSHPIWGHTKLVYMKKDINSEHVWFNNCGSKLWTSTDSIGSRNNYVLTFNARTKNHSGSFLVSVKLHTNGYTQTLTKPIDITPQRHVYNFEFNTFGIYPTYVTFSWKYLGFYDRPELFSDLKKNKNIEEQIKLGHYTYGYIKHHVIPGTNYVHPKVKKILAFKRRPDTVYFPDEPCYVYEGGNIVNHHEERYSDLKADANSYKQMKTGKYTYAYVKNHLLSQRRIDAKSDLVPVPDFVAEDKKNSIDDVNNHFSVNYQKALKLNDKYSTLNGSKVIDDINQDSNPADVNTIDNTLVGKSDITPGWNFNGNIPLSYYPAIFNRNGKIISGYVSVKALKSIPHKYHHLALVPDGHGDYALGYDLYGKLKGYRHAYMQDVKTHKFIRVYGPSKFTTIITPNVDTSEVMFRDISCHLLTRVNVDGHLVHHLAPQVNFKGQDTVAYNDIIFGQPVNEKILGETFDDLQHYQTDFNEFKRYGITYDDLLEHILLPDKDMTWANLAKGKLNWQDAQSQEWLWEPLVMYNARIRKYLDNPKRDTTTYYDLEQYEVPETFKDLQDGHITLEDFEKNNITMEDLLHRFNKSDKAIPYTFRAAKENDWRFNDGEPMDYKEHCVTVDLGRVYTNIKDLLVQHGSDSIKNAVYDSCVQTSSDGIHWHTWYDNYKGYKYPLDKHYIEPTGAPVSIPISKYDIVNNRQDFNEDLSNKDYVSADVEYWPIKNLSSFLFNDDRQHIGLYVQKYMQSNNNVLSYIPSLQDMLKMKLNSKATLAGNNNQVTTFSNKVNKTNNTDSLITTEYNDKYERINSNHYYPIVPIPPNDALKGVDKGKPLLSANYITSSGYHMTNIDDALRLNNLTTLLNSDSVLYGDPYKVKKHTTLHRPPLNYEGLDHHNIQKYYRNALYLNNMDTLLNSKAVLQNGQFIHRINHMNVNKGGSHAGTIPNPPSSDYLYDNILMKFDLRNLLLNKYPNLIHNLHKYSVTNNYKQFIDNLIGQCTTLYLTVKGQTVGPWNVSIWNFDKKSWQYTQVNHINGECTLRIHNFKDCINDGHIYAMVEADDPNLDIKPIMKIKATNLELVTNVTAINNFNGGLYPHWNYEYNVNHVYHIKPNDSDIVTMPWIYKSVYGHKITFTFDMLAKASGNQFILDLDGTKTSMVPIEKGPQVFSFIFDIPAKMGNEKNLIPKLVIPNHNTDIYIYGVKAEIGVKDTPYVFPEEYSEN